MLAPPSSENKILRIQHYYILLYNTTYFILYRITTYYQIILYRITTYHQITSISMNYYGVISSLLHNTTTCYHYCHQRYYILRAITSIYVFLPIPSVRSTQYMSQSGSIANRAFLSIDFIVLAVISAALNLICMKEHVPI